MKALAKFERQSNNIDKDHDHKGMIIDDVYNFAEIDLLNIINFTTEQSIPLLMTANEYPYFEIKDLSSRIKATYKVILKNPDISLLKLLKLGLKN